jgi:hypothetical protein
MAEYSRSFRLDRGMIAAHRGMDPTNRKLHEGSSTGRPSYSAFDDSNI